MAAADEALADFIEKHTALSAIDPWQEYVIKNRERLQADNLYRYSVDKLLTSSEINEVKYGMILLELFTLQDEKVKDAVRTVGLSDEFTLFSVFIMRKWEYANEEIFRLAKHVHGWGRIHAIDQLEASTQEISDWLLHEGTKNLVLPAYSALSCFEKADVPKRLQKTLSHEEFVDIGNILVCMLDEGACEGISAVGDDVLETYLEHVQSRTLDFSDYQRISAFYDYGLEKDNHILREKCEKLLHGEECRRLVDQAIELFAGKLPLRQMQTGPADEMGLSKVYDDYRKLVMIVQELGDKPGKGEQLLQTALRAPVINNRHMALTVLESWVEILGRPIKVISLALYDVLLEMKSQEMVETVRERMEKLIVY